MTLPKYLPREAYERLPEDVKKLYAWRARCPTCRTVYYSRDPGSAVYCNRCGTLFDFYPHFVRVLARVLDDKG